MKDGISVCACIIYNVKDCKWKQGKSGIIIGLYASVKKSGLLAMQETIIYLVKFLDGL